MHVLHISAECYPAAKVGGLADVVGSLPIYLNKKGFNCEVLMPKYYNSWITSQEFDTVYESELFLGSNQIPFSIQKLKEGVLGFPLYVVDIPGYFDRPGIYADPVHKTPYLDEAERFIAFQIAALEWVNSLAEKPQIIHCHDHHTGLVPFMLTKCFRYKNIAHVPTVLTVHNAEYQGWYPKEKYRLLPAFNMQDFGLLEWNNEINALASGIKCAWKITTVSENYMQELASNSNGLEALFAHEAGKSKGIINGIDTDVWNPSTDKYLEHNYSFRNRRSGMQKNKEALCEKYDFNPNLPLIAFIGRLVKEKGADLLPDLYANILEKNDRVNFVLLGTGDPELHKRFGQMNHKHFGFFDATLQYNEQLAHQIYAGADFIFMPSRVEPCGLNQMFAMRYGTIPIVRTVGGLKDTVKDISEKDGYGIRFDDFTISAAKNAIERAIKLFNNKKKLAHVISSIMKLDFSWNNSANEYIKLYKSLT